VWIALIGITVNTYFFSVIHLISNITLQDLPSNMGMNINNFIISNVDNYHEVRGCTMTSNKNFSRTVSITSSKASVDYATRMERLNNVFEETTHKELIDSLQLSYVDNEDI